MHFYVHVNTLKLSVNLTAIIEGTALKMIGSICYSSSEHFISFSKEKEIYTPFHGKTNSFL